MFTSSVFILDIFYLIITYFILNGYLILVPVLFYAASKASGALNSTADEWTLGRQHHGFHTDCHLEKRTWISLCAEAFMFIIVIVSNG